MEFTSSHARAFKGMQTIKIPSGYTSIRSWAFAKNENLVAVIIPPEITTIGEGAFSNCKNLKSVTMPGVSKIDELAFAHCTSLQEIVFPHSLRYICEGAFNNCTNLKKVTLLSTNLESIDDMAFSSCGSLEYFIIAEGIDRLSKNPFYNCKSSIKFVLPNSIKHIDPYVFRDLNKLTIICPEDSYAEKYCQQNGINVSTSLLSAQDEKPLHTMTDDTQNDESSDKTKMWSAIVYALICGGIGFWIWGGGAVVPSVIVGAIIGVAIANHNGY